MTHNPFDEFARSLVVDRQAFFGHAETECELTRDALYADLAWEPDRNLLPKRSRDLVDRMARVASLWEFAHRPPDFLTAVTCVDKVLAWHRQRVARAKARRRRAPPMAPLWLICAGTPRKLRLALSFAPMKDWPRGFYEGPDGSALCLVLVRELPVRADTLLLRLMGAGVVLRRAVAEVEALPSAPTPRSSTPASPRSAPQAPGRSARRAPLGLRRSPCSARWSGRRSSGAGSSWASRRPIPASRRAHRGSARTTLAAESGERVAREILSAV